jgi:hypothetical protein
LILATIFFDYFTWIFIRYTIFASPFGIFRYIWHFHRHLKILYCWLFLGSRRRWWYVFVFHVLIIFHRKQVYHDGLLNFLFFELFIKSAFLIAKYKFSNFGLNELIRLILWRLVLIMKYLLFLVHCLIWTIITFKFVSFNRTNN